MQLTVQEAARLLRASESNVQRWIRDGGLPAVRFNEQLRLNRVDLMVWAHRNHHALDPALLQDGSEAAPDLRAALLRGGIHRDIAARDGRAVLQEVVARLPLTAVADRGLLSELLTARAAAGGASAVGHGIAIPDARHPIVQPGEPLLLALFLLRAPVDLDVADGRGTHAIFVLVSPRIRDHLLALAHLVRVLHGPASQSIADRADDAVLLAAMTVQDDAGRSG